MQNVYVFVIVDLDKPLNKYLCRLWIEISLLTRGVTEMRVYNNSKLNLSACLHCNIILHLRHSKYNWLGESNHKHKWPFSDPDKNTQLTFYI